MSKMIPDNLYDFEPMSVGRIFEYTFRIYRDNFIRFVTIVAVIQVPISMLVVVSSFAFQRGVPVRRLTDYGPSSDDDQQTRQGAGIERLRTSLANVEQVESDPSIAAFLGKLGRLIPGILGLFGQVLCAGVLTKSVSESYFGNEITVRQAYRFVLPKLLALTRAGICVVLVVHLGLFLLVVPGIIFALWFALTSPAIVVENLKATEGMSRSKGLVSGNFGKAFSICFLFFLLALIESILSVYGVPFLGRIMFANNTTLIAFVTQLATVMGKTLIVPIGTTAFILLYHDLRIRKEGFDLEMLAESITHN